MKLERQVAIASSANKVAASDALYMFLEESRDSSEDDAINRHVGAVRSGDRTIFRYKYIDNRYLLSYRGNI